MKKRIEWIDVAKCFGIFAIYLGHFGESVGKGYFFVFQYHVALFFFLSGCMSTYDKETNVGRYLIKKVKHIMVPFWVFAALSIVLRVIASRPQLAEVKELLMIVLKGCVRNTFFASSLWFLTCLFVMEIVFKFIRYIKNKWLIGVICVGLFVVAECIMNPSPIKEPSWIYNVDSACYYMIFYGAGYLSYSWIQEVFEKDKPWKKVMFWTTGILTFVYAALLFMEKDYLIWAVCKVPGLRVFAAVIRAFLLIWANLVAAKLVEKVRILTIIGKNTLYLCGNEYMIKAIVPRVLGIVGISCMFYSPWIVCVYTAVLLVLGIVIVVPIEKNILEGVQFLIKKQKEKQS